MAVVATGALLLAGAPGASGPPPGAEPRAQAGARPGSVTLVTSDRVTVSGSSVVIEPGPGRSTMVFERYGYGDHQYVIPADAIELVRQGALDRRLFDVATLLESGYGDADRDDLPLIVAHEPHARAAIDAAGTTTRIPQVGLSAVRTPKRDAGKLWAAVRGGAATETATATLSPGISTVWLDGQRQLALEQSVHQVNAPAAWQAGWTGAGVSVAVLDSGIDATHPDFTGRIVEVRNFTGAPDGNDTVGHGTHVASILAGSGEASGGRFRGIAPDADLLVGKVCPTTSCPESAVLAGMAWAAEQGAAVVNLSLSGPDGPGLDPLEAAVNELTAQFGTLFVASAGNLGPSRSIGSPASADAALAVGSLDRFNNVSVSSSRGPRVDDWVVKPDIAAPGEGIVAARAADGTIGEPVDPFYTRLSGTSMAAPHVAGAVALLAQEHPDWTGPQVKAALMGSAVSDPGYTVFDLGAGRLDLARAIQQSVVTSPPSISFGLRPFPHDGEPVDRVVTLHNLGPTPVTLQLSAEVRGPTGQAAPPGMFVVSPGSVTVPAGGDAEVTVTVDVRVDSPLGFFTGALVAAGDGATVRTPLGMEKEPERYQLTVNHVDRAGQASGDYVTHVLGLESGFQSTSFGGADTLNLRLPPGRYHLYSVIHTPAGDRVDVAALAQPLLELTGDMSLTLDARAARPMRVQVPARHDSARSAAGIVLYERRAPDGVGMAASVAGPDLDHTYTAHLGPEVADGDLVAAVHSQWGEPGEAGDFMDSPYAYHLAWFERGRYWTGFDRTVLPRDLAAVPTGYRTPTPDRIGRHVALGTAPEGSAGAGFLFPFRLPFERVDYYVARDVVWHHEVETMHPETDLVETVHRSPLVSYHPGWQAGGPAELWNGGVFGPAFPPQEGVTQWIYRHPGSLPTVAGVGTAQDSDAIVVSVPLYNDLSPDHSGSSREDSGRIALFLDGELIGEAETSVSAEFSVPDAPGSYRLEVEGTRPTYADLSTRVRGTWTFQSGHDPEVEAVVLPVMAVRFEPGLDQHNAAPAGQEFPLPISIQRQAGASPADVTHLRVEVSYDDGESWQPAPVHRAGGGWQAQLHHPAGAEHVSLRAAATDSAGGTVEIEIIRGYRLHPAG